MNKNVIIESERTTPVIDNVDVLVCGAGPAGVAAAVASARQGAKTALVEAHGCLGGAWTAGLVAWIIDHTNKTGIMAEILQRLQQLNGRAILHSIPTNAFDVEIMKLLLDDMCRQAGVIVRQYHLLVDAHLQDNRLTHAILESKSGRQAIQSKIFIDCTGDGDLAARAGCQFELGRPDSGQTQPMSLLALVAGLDPRQISSLFRHPGNISHSEPKENLRREMQKAGMAPSYAAPSLFWIRDDLFLLMANHEYARSAINAKDLSDAAASARQELHTLVNGLRGLGGIWQKIYIVATAPSIGVREGRRIAGRYLVTAEDMIQGRRHPDAVCRVSFGIDVHSTDHKHGKHVENTAIHTQPYDIPLRALIARDVDALMMAGRCISGDFLAHSSYRVTGNAVAMGQAAGQTAAQAAINNCLPQQCTQ